MGVSILIAVCLAVLIFLAIEQWGTGHGYFAEQIKQLVGRGGG